MWDVWNGYNKKAFIRALPRCAHILDVGCGGDSPAITKSLRPDIVYSGLDVSDGIHTLSPPDKADEYLLVLARDFAAAIESQAGRFDAVISSHNIEHCDEPERVLRAMVSALKPGGLLFLSYPSDASLGFPSRAGCLNFHDDPSHRDHIAFRAVQQQITASGADITVTIKRHHPLIPMIVGLLMEPVSRIRHAVTRGTWALWGFEAILWAKAHCVPEHSAKPEKSVAAPAVIVTVEPDAEVVRVVNPPELPDAGQIASIRAVVIVPFCTRYSPTTVSAPLLLL